MSALLEQSIDWQAHVTQWQMSGLSKKNFCQEQALPYRTFLKHCQRVKHAEKSAVAAVDAKLSSLPALPTFIPVQTPSSNNEVSESLPLTLVLSKRFRLEIPIASVQAPLLNTVFKSLGILP